MTNQNYFNGEGLRKVKCSTLHNAVKGGDV